MPMAILLRHHSHFVGLYYVGVFLKCNKTPREEMIRQFLEQDGENRPFSVDIRQRVEQSERYVQYLKDNDLFVPDEHVTEMRKNIEE